MSIGDGWMIVIAPAPTTTLETMNMAILTEADWMTEATMIMTPPKNSVQRRPILSESVPQMGNIKIEPADCAALTAPKS
jgi:hypothetical protein